jgi:diacylglycerol kinase
MVERGPLAARIDAFRYALRGLHDMMRDEPHARFHAVATATVLAAGFAFRIERSEWLAILLTVGAVWSLEAMNTAVETICDLICPDPDEQVRKAKDVAAGGVLVAAVVALGVAAIVFGPRIAHLIH